MSGPVARPVPVTRARGMACTTAPLPGAACGASKFARTVQAANARLQKKGLKPLKLWKLKVLEHARNFATCSVAICSSYLSLRQVLVKLCEGGIEGALQAVRAAEAAAATVPTAA